MSDLTKSEKCRRIAEGLGLGPTPEGLWSRPGKMGRFEVPPDFYTDEAANALVLEAMPSPCLYREAHHNGHKWWCRPDNLTGEGKPSIDADRKTAVCEAYLKMLEER